MDLDQKIAINRDLDSLITHTNTLLKVLIPEDDDKDFEPYAGVQVMACLGRALMMLKMLEHEQINVIWTVPEWQQMIWDLHKVLPKNKDGFDQICRTMRKEIIKREEKENGS